MTAKKPATTAVVVASQKEFDDAIANPTITDVTVDAPATVTIDIPATNGKSVMVRGESSIDRVYGTARIGWVYDTASIGSVYDTASIGSVCDTARIDRVYGTARIDRVYGTARIGSVYGTAVVRLAGDARITHAAKFVTVYRSSTTCTIGGTPHIVDMTAVDLSDPATWCDLHGLKVSRGFVTLIKAVDDGYLSGRGFAYPLGEKVTEPEWTPGNFCGGGLHVSPSTYDARTYFTGATRFVEVKVKLVDLCPITSEGGAPKAKVRAGTVVREVALDGVPV